LSLFCALDIFSIFLIIVLVIDTLVQVVHSVSILLFVEIVLFIYFNITFKLFALLIYSQLSIIYFIVVVVIVLIIHFIDDLIL